MEKSLWDQSVRHWLTSTAVWFCGALALIVTAHTKTTVVAQSAKPATAVTQSQPKQTQTPAASPIQQVTFKVKVLNLSDYTDASYADASQ